MSELNNNELIDLGSEPVGENFDPFAEEDNSDDVAIGVATGIATDTATMQELEAEAQAQEEPVAEVPAAAETSAATNTPTDAPTKDVVSKAASSASPKETEKSEQEDEDKPPVFEYAGATENIDDTSKSFDELRIEKSSDFPELEDGKRVSWTVEYGKVTKTVADPKGTSIGKMKSDIETSKEFADALKKRGADKNPVCKIKPRVTAQSKGIVSAYKGVFPNMDEAENSGKVISLFPAKDGKVYEMRKTEMGKFITPISGSDILSDVRAGFIPALPLIPVELMFKIISFFRYFMNLGAEGAEKEALVNVYWDKVNHGFFVDVPKQVVTKASVNSEISDDYADDRYIHYMDIHSHNSMRAFFSHIDDRDERATRLYSVIGNLDKYLPDIKTRFSNGGTFHEIDPAIVFERVECSFPTAWTENVRFRSLHGDDKGENLKARTAL